MIDRNQEAPLQESTRLRQASDSLASELAQLAQVSERPRRVGRGVGVEFGPVTLE